MPFKPGVPGLEVQVLEVLERIVLGHVDGLEIAASMYGWIAACIRMWSRAEISSALTKAGGSVHVAAAAR